MIHGLKYEGQTWVVPVVAEAMAKRAESALIKDQDSLSFHPLHSSRLRERGYNQSLLLARKW
jgi:predicted amidophosphoribosyltransferase